MRSKLYLALLMIPFLVLPSCLTKENAPHLTPIQRATCNAELALTKGTALGIATVLSCTGTNEIQKDLMGIFGNVDLCQEAEAARVQGLVGALVCPLAVSAIIGFASHQIPTEWKCDPDKSATVDVFKKAVVTACVAAIPL